MHLLLARTCHCLLNISELVSINDSKMEVWARMHLHFFMLVFCCMDNLETV